MAFALAIKSVSLDIYSLFLIPYSLFLIPYSLFLIPYSLSILSIAGSERFSLRRAQCIDFFVGIRTLKNWR
ncbi:hypothetical protein BU546_23110 [Salmonella enterica]|nr:hypothetical protein [Salmonella enterica]TAD52915.1 hypothetical protein DBZ77_08160 [Salmonella enterica subsp. enterica serovar Bovismorbificans]